MDKADKLVEALAPLEKFVVAFSGGVDSTVVLAAGIRAVGAHNVLAVTARSPLHHPSEAAEAAAIAAGMGVAHRIVEADLLLKPQILHNRHDRCYHCKRLILATVFRAAEEWGTQTVLDGTHADDRNGYRPGIAALVEFGVHSPLKKCGFSKRDVRALAMHWNVQVKDKPASPCLATRIPYDTEIRLSDLAKIAAGEQLLKDAGFAVCRLRHHGELARIEVPENELSQLLEAGGLREAVRGLGYKFVAADLFGFRSGSFDE